VNWLKGYLALPGPGRKLAWRCLLLLPMASTLLGIFGLAATAGFFGRLSRKTADHRNALVPTEVARVVNGTAALLRAACLPRSVVLCILLRNRGKSAEIRLGVSRAADGEFLAHAWVELDGCPLNEPADLLDRYHSMPSPADRIRIRHA